MSLSQDTLNTKDTLNANELKTLREKYILRNGWRERWKFLQKYPSLAPVLLEAHDNITKYFPNNPPVFLRLNIAPEDLSEDELVASVASGLEVDTAVDMLNEFDEGWWLAALTRASGKLCITLE